MTNTQIVIAELPSDSLTPAHFKQTTADMPVAGDGQVLLKVILMSIDAANRSWMKGATYRAAVNAGDAMPTYAICEVVESNSGRLAVGDIVASEANHPITSKEGAKEITPSVVMRLCVGLIPIIPQ